MNTHARGASGELSVSTPAADTTRREEPGSIPASDGSAGIDVDRLAEAIDSIAWPGSTSPLGYESGIWVRAFAEAIAQRYRELG